MTTDSLAPRSPPWQTPAGAPILERLAGGDAAVGASWPSRSPWHSRQSERLAILEQASLISKSRRGPATHMRITATPLQNADTWLNEYRRHWEANLDSLDASLTRLQSQEKPS